MSQFPSVLQNIPENSTQFPENMRPNRRRLSREQRWLEWYKLDPSIYDFLCRLHNALKTSAETRPSAEEEV